MILPAYATEIVNCSFNNCPALMQINSIDIQIQNIIRDYRNGNIQKCIHQALALLPVLAGRVEKIKVYLVLAQAYTRLSNHPESLEYCRIANELLEAHDDINYLIMLKICRAAAMLQASAIEQALQLLRQAIEHMQGVDADPYVQAMIYDLMAKCYSGMGLDLRAMETYALALNCIRSSGNKLEEAQIMQNYASLFHLNIKDSAKALIMLEQAYMVASQYNDRIGMCACLNSLAGISMQIQDYDNGRKYLENAMLLMDENIPELQTFYASVLESYVVLEIRTNNIAMAWPWLNKLMDMAAKNELNFHINGYSLHSASMYYNSIGEYQTAFDYFRRYHKMVLNLHNQQNSSQLQLMHLLFETQKLENENTINSMKNQKLEMDIRLKENELTALALHLSQKNTTLLRLNNLLESDNEKPAALLRKIQTEIRSSITDDQAWKSFEQQFIQTHHSFNSNLLQTFPDLSPAELKVCAMIKLNLSSKDMAAILCVEISTIEIYRHRIRKKMNLKRDQNLISFLATF